MKYNKFDNKYKNKDFEKKRFGIKVKFSKTDRNSWKKEIKCG